MTSLPDHNGKPRRRRGLTTKMLAYATQNADRPLTVTELAREVDCGYPSVSSTMNRLLSKYPQLHRPQRGVWEWRSQPVPPVVPSPQSYLMLRVLQRREGGAGTEALVIDEETDKIYRVSELKVW